VKVKLTYFKDSGKYYSEARYASMNEFDYLVYREVREMVERGDLPGLRAGARFTVLVQPGDGVPALVFVSNTPRQNDDG